MTQNFHTKNGALPNLVVIGAMKCGTSILHYYLDLHPEIRMSLEKELNFFNNEKNWAKGVEWYKSNFHGSAKINGEASPTYTQFPRYRHIPERMRATVPGAKLIYLVRDPIERSLSHYLHVQMNGYEKRTFSEALENFEANPYVDVSRYYFQLEQYLPHFRKENILIISQEDLYSNRRDTLKKVFRFLGVDENFEHKDFSIVKPSTRRFERKVIHILKAPQIHRLFPRKARWKIRDWVLSPFVSKSGRPALDGRLREKLIDYLKDDINRLRQFTGCEFKNWSV